MQNIFNCSCHATWLPPKTSSLDNSIIVTSIISQGRFWSVNPRNVNGNLFFSFANKRSPTLVLLFKLQLIAAVTVSLNRQKDIL